VDDPTAVSDSGSSTNDDSFGKGCIAAELPVLPLRTRSACPHRAFVPPPSIRWRDERCLLADALDGDGDLAGRVDAGNVQLAGKVATALVALDHLAPKSEWSIVGLDSARALGGACGQAQSGQRDAAR
jgi:hypothetical protein